MLRPHPHSVCEDDSLPAQTLRALQRHSFDYFVHEINQDNGLVLDKTAPDWPASIAAMGMASRRTRWASSASSWPAPMPLRAP